MRHTLIVGFLAALVLGGLRFEHAAAAECSANFAHSDMWLFSFRPVSCSSNGWSISRRAGQFVTQCAALDPSGRLVFVAASNKAEYALFRNLQHDAWITTADQFADVQIKVDASRQFQAVDQVDVSASPPLRYGVIWPLQRADVTSLQRGNAVTVSIAGASWTIPLRGSSEAMDAARICASWDAQRENGDSAHRSVSQKAWLTPSQQCEADRKYIRGLIAKGLVDPRSPAANYYRAKGCF